MNSTVHLIIHNIVSIVSSVTLLGIALFTYLNGPKRTSNITFTLTMLAAAIFTVSHVIGVNISDPNLSRFFLMFNLTVFFIGAFNLHATFAIIDKEKEKRWLIISTYAASILLVILFSLFPDLFLLPSVPKMYFPNYYNPGSLNLIRIIFLYGIIVPYMLYETFAAYRKSEHPSERSQYKYYMLVLVFGYVLGFIPNFLVYNIQVDPLWGMLFSLALTIPLMFGAVLYGLFNVKVVAKQALLYSMSVGVVGLLIAVFNYSNVWIQSIVPNFPLWITALISAVIVVSASIFVWRALRQNDILKYEFITTVTHKFRTPMTHIKWASENLSKSGLSKEDMEQIRYIESANMKLVELTDLLVNASEGDNDVYKYDVEIGDISSVTEEVLSALESHFFVKKINVVKNIEPGVRVSFNLPRIFFVIQTLVENAVSYSPEGGTVTITVRLETSNVVLSVSDTGIGIEKEELPLIFSKFYRGSQARNKDTEGMGIGLYIAKNIIERHGGKIWAESDGKNRGSTFSFSIPTLKNGALKNGAIK